ncbi:MAG: hypothetical protein ISR70_01505 [Candidatus Thioglobus sp.]|nr:hypothetical protein [Candidatus Thioglobus sp.]
MKKSLFVAISSLAILLLSSCSTMVVKEENAHTFNTWELCTLLYRPNQMYSDWYVDKEENKNIEKELNKRGVLNKKSCDVVELAKRQCTEFGHKDATQNFIDCTAKEFKNINDKVAAIKQNKQKEDSEAAKSFINGWNTGLNNAYQPIQRTPVCTTSVLTGQVTCY